jgi:hypothetical protein
MKRYLKNIDPPSQFSFWIGLTDARVEGTFEWFSSGRVANYFYWGPGEPKNSATFDCVQAGPNSNRYWTMDNCANLSFPLCEQGSK